MLYIPEFAAFRCNAAPLRLALPPEISSRNLFQFLCTGMRIGSEAYSVPFMLLNKIKGSLNVHRKIDGHSTTVLLRKKFCASLPGLVLEGEVSTLGAHSSFSFTISFCIV